MKLLILGGTRFVGRHLAQAALERGHTVTLFNRGNHPGLFPEAEELTGDRGGDLSALGGRRWDAVIDTSGYTPRQLRSSTELLRNAAARYLFISSISVYAEQATPFQDEDAPLAQLEDESTETVTAETYGGLKVLCERVVQRAFPETHLVLRPGLVVGPHDPTDRFTYWPVRVAAGGEVLAPAGPEAPVQFIDARDLAEFGLALLEASRSGIFNVVSDPDQFDFGALLASCRQASSSDASFTWVDEAFLLAQGVRPFADLPLWLPEDARGFARISNDRARAAGLEIRSLAQTVQDTLAWARTRAPDAPRQAGLSREREWELLEAWRGAR